MAPEWIYLLKVNVGIALFYAFYKLFCQRDTFFQWRRFALLSFLGISLVYPLLNIQAWVKEQPAMYELADYYATLMMMEEMEAVATSSPTPQLPDLLTIAIGIYFIGVGILSLRFFIQLLSIFRMRWIGKTMYLSGQRIISLPFEANPFSFFGWIFLYLPKLEKDSQNEILMHEQTHSRQWHSIDVILIEIINIVCWFNPFSWLLKTEIRLNLEYLADNKVSETTQDCKQYQYHLLGLANTNRQTGLYNNFNVSHIKRRIIMMNKKRSRTTGRIKYALFAPLAAALLLVSNIEAVARTAEKIMSVDKPVVIKKSPELSTETENLPQQEKIHQIAEEMPEFPGGMAECMKFLGKNIKYPAEAITNKIEGRVIVTIVIRKDGSVTDAKIVRSIHPLLDEEALRVISLMPKWKPAKHKGEAVNVMYTLPVMFRLNKPESEVQHETSDAEGTRFKKVKVEEVQELKDENGIYRVCDEMPEFPGGMAACMKFLAENIQYPEDCMKEGIQGRVIIQFVIDKDGTAKDIIVVRGVHPSLDKEALRVASLMPKWKPGITKGEAVACKYTIPIGFKLSLPTASEATISNK